MSLRIKSESGQAATEYILLLVITVGLILALITQFFKPVQNFISSYMGDYTACLLQTGELPAFGGESTIASDVGCESKFAPGTLANGRPPLDGAGSSKSGGGKDKSSSDSGGGAGAGAGTGGYAGSSSRGGSSRMFNSSRGTKSGDLGSGNSGKSTDIPVEGGGNGSFFNSNSSSVVVIRRNKSISISGAQFSAEMKKKIEKKQAGARRVIASEGLSIPPKKTSVKKSERKIDSIAEDEEFTIGNFMRMLLIVGIVLAIVIFVGGQVLQMSKNSDS